LPAAKDQDCGMHCKPQVSAIEPITLLMQDYWQRMWTQIQQEARDAVQDIDNTKRLVADNRRKILDACKNVE
jgi:hypothetical protein